LTSKVNSALFELIKSMSKSEKRYFKIISSRHTIGEENNYVRLFDYLEGIECYDEQALFQVFEGEAFLHRFSITKKRLYDHVLNALNAFHAEQSQTAQLYGMLQSAEVLFNKSLYDQCRRILSSAEKLAVKQENDLVLQLIYQFQQKLIETIGYVSADWKEVHKLIGSVKESGDRTAFTNELWRVKSELFRQLIGKGIARNEDERDVFHEICAPLKDELNLSLLNSESVYLMNHIRSVYHYAIGDVNKSYQFLKKNLGHFENNSDWYTREPAKLISVLTNAIYVSDKLGKHTESLVMLGQLKSILADKELNEDLKIKTFATYSSIILSLSIRMGNFSEAAKESIKVEEKLEEFGNRLNSTRRAHLSYKIAVICFGNEDYSGSLKRINAILNDAELDANENLIGFAHLLELAIYIELEKIELLKYKLKSVERFTKSRDRMHPLETTFLRFVADWLRCDDLFKRKELLSETISKLKEIEINNPIEAMVQDYFDVSSWMESRLSGKPMSAIIRERYNKVMRSAS
jgi:hypothetical protein